MLVSSQSDHQRPVLMMFGEDEVQADGGTRNDWANGKDAHPPLQTMMYIDAPLLVGCELIVHEPFTGVTRAFDCSRLVVSG